MNMFWMRGPVRDADGAGAAAGAAGDAAGAAAAGTQPGSLLEAAGAAAAGDGSSPSPNGQASGAGGDGSRAPWRPEGLPDHLAGTTPEETLGKLWGAYDGARRDIAERGTVPKDPADYKFAPADDVKEFVGDLSADPLFQKVHALAHSNKLTDAQFNGFVNGFVKELVAMELLDKPVDYGAEIAALIPLEAKGQDEAGQKAAASRRISENIAWVKGLKDQGNLEPDVADHLIAQLGDSAKGIRAVESLRKLLQEVAPALNGQETNGQTEADYDKLLGDPRQNSNDPKIKQAWAAEKEALAKRLWGTAPRT